MRAFFLRHRATIGYLILALAIVVGLYRSEHNRAVADRHIEEARAERIMQLNEINRTQCTDLNQLQDTILTILRASDKSLGTPGTPGYAYYQEHPDELAVAHKANQASIDRLDNPACSGVVVSIQP